jgi:hypothetical protein
MQLVLAILALIRRLLAISLLPDTTAIRSDMPGLQVAESFQPVDDTLKTPVGARCEDVVRLQKARADLPMIRKREMRQLGRRDAIM